eukprot:CAMPEP_0197536096 /NCGR_PEP_ID=MMETSP1318-20131121/52922_1 /TAXON_ID=552666 /ORGANISM="Partenskyella glossopodia, Strain RCC365" /LENGTH=197 /DNA_ID=CAMNT_0043093885 /DNA_START=17 /DNA_END=610 /DNA_ORIENTATION=-
MTSARFFAFMRHCGFVNEVKASRIISHIRAQARESRRKHKMPPTPREIIEKQRVYTGPGTLDPADIDILLTKVNRKHKDLPNRTLHFDGFCEMVERVALKVFDDTEEQSRQKAIGVIKKIVMPVLTGTVAQPCKYHDDKELYTGVWRNGGPGIFDIPAISLCNIMDRSPANIRGVNLKFSKHKMHPFPQRKNTNYEK